MVGGMNPCKPLCVRHLRLRQDIDGVIPELARGIQSMLNNLQNLVAQIQDSSLHVASSATEFAAMTHQYRFGWGCRGLVGPGDKPPAPHKNYF